MASIHKDSDGHLTVYTAAQARCKQPVELFLHPDLATRLKEAEQLSNGSVDDAEALGLAIISALSLYATVGRKVGTGALLQYAAKAG